MSKTTNKFSPEVRERSVRMVLDYQVDYPSRWAAVVSIAEKIGCVPQTLHEWVRKGEIEFRRGILAPVAGYSASKSSTPIDTSGEDLGRSRRR